MKKVKPKIKFYVLGVRLWQVPMKDAIMSLLVFIRLTTQIRRDSVIHQALNKFMLETKVQRKVVPKRIADLYVRKRLASSENKNVDKMLREEARMKEISAFDPELKVINRSIRMMFQTFFIRSK